jgi:hypothetical protein
MEKEEGINPMKLGSKLNRSGKNTNIGFNATYMGLLGVVTGNG